MSEVSAAVGAPLGLWCWGDPPTPVAACHQGAAGCARTCPFSCLPDSGPPGLPVATCSRKRIAAREGESFCTPGMLILAPEGLCLGQTVQVSVYAHARVQARGFRGCSWVRAEGPS